MEVTTATFEQEVIEASKTVPVVVDFWAPWCGPCRALGPIIEKVVGEFDGGVKLVKVNSDDNPELSQAFGIRSIPTVVAFKAGQIASHFLGALPEPQVREFVARLVPSAAEEALARAEALLEAGRIEDAADALSAVERVPVLAARIDAAEQAIAFARAGAQGPAEQDLRARLAADASDHEARLALAGFYASQRRFADAMEQLLDIVRRDKNWRDGEARKQLLSLFNVAAAHPDLVAEYRRKLASTLH